MDFFDISDPNAPNEPNDLNVPNALNEPNVLNAPNALNEPNVLNVPNEPNEPNVLNAPAGNRHEFHRGTLLTRIPQSGTHGLTRRLFAGNMTSRNLYNLLNV